MLPADLDPTALLQALGLGQWATAMVLLLSLFIAVLTHVMPYVPAPQPTAVLWWRLLFHILLVVTGNYRNARNYNPAPAPVAAVQPAPPATPVPPVV